MPSRRSMLVLLSQTVLGTLLIGCEPPPKPAPPLPPPPATSNVIAQTQSDLQSHDPSARVGSVVRLLTSDNLAAISFIAGNGTATTELRTGDAFTFTDSKMNPVANGKLVSIDGSIYVVKYVSAPGGRAPIVGDVAIHVSTK